MSNKEGLGWKTRGETDTNTRQRWGSAFDAIKVDDERKRPFLPFLHVRKEVRKSY